MIERYEKESQRLGFLYKFTKLGLSSFGASKVTAFNELRLHLHLQLHEVARLGG